MDDKIDIHALNQINFERSCAFKHIAELKNMPNTKEVQELRKQVLNLTMNICMDLTCSHRIRETTRKYGKNKDRFDETSNSSRG